MTVFWHVILDFPSIGLLKEGLKEDVARELKAAVVRQLIDMDIKQFLGYCHVEQRRALPDLEMKTRPQHLQEYIDDGYKRPGKIVDEKK